MPKWTMPLSPSLLLALRAQAERQQDSLPKLLARLLPSATAPQDAVGDMLEFARTQGFTLGEGLRIRDLWLKPTAP